ncbi:uncharacterized protein IWZ02DRAFT_232622 [Phyllosticta citriasiana]|uniref:uncharacterized protein n=1 Tax=Phyllosticta citriasiana TaxID=595635 RepID=UPI0030FDA376
MAFMVLITIFFFLLHSSQDARVLRPCARRDLIQTCHSPSRGRSERCGSRASNYLRLETSKSAVFHGSSSNYPRCWLVDPVFACQAQWIWTLKIQEACVKHRRANCNKGFMLVHPKIITRF